MPLMSTVTLQMTNDPKVVYFEGNTYPYRALIGVMPGASWGKPAVTKKWNLPLESVGDALRIFPSLVVAPEVTKAYVAVNQRNQQAVAIKKQDFRMVRPEDIKGLKGTLRNYQQVGVNFLRTLDDGEGAILAFDMGLGKSFTALAYGQELINMGVIDHIMVVCPSPLKYATWEKEIKKFTNLEYQVVDGDKRETVEWDDGTVEKLEGRRLREVQYQQHQFGTRVTIMNYELFLYDYISEDYTTVRPLTEVEVAELEKTKQRISVEKSLVVDNDKVKKLAIAEFLPKLIGNPKGYTIRGNKKPELVLVNPLPRIIPNVDKRWLVVLDEAHRIKNPKADITKNLLKCLTPAGRKVLGTGTPLENNIQELHSLVDFCRPNLLGNYYKFLDRYVESDYFGKPIAPKPQMMQELRDRIAPIMIRKTKAEALPELPPLERVSYDVEMTPTQRKLYAQIKEGILQNARTGEFSYMEVIVQMTRLQQVLDSPALLRNLLEDPTLPIASGKLNELSNVITDLDPTRNKFILFSQYREMTDILYEWLTTPGVAKGGRQVPAILPKDKVGYIRGGVKSTYFEEVRHGFQEGGIQCVLMTTAGNYGLDLYNAKYVICYDQLFNPQKMEQVLSRGHRSGNTTGVTAINFRTRGSYEEHKEAVLEKKRELFRAFVDADDLAFMKLFTKQELIDML